MVAVLLREPDVLCVTGLGLLGEGLTSATPGLDWTSACPYRSRQHQTRSLPPTRLASRLPGKLVIVPGGSGARSPPRGRPGAINWRAITALLAATDYNGRFRGGWFLLARRGDAGRPVAPCLGGQNDRWYGSA
jgi:hypothetical protein